MSEEKNAIESAILNIGDKMKDIMAISEQPVEPTPSETDDGELEEPGEEAPRRGRKRGSGAGGDGFTSRVDGTKSLTVRLLPVDLKKLRLIALSNERSPRDEIVSMIQERYRQMAKAILTED